MLKIQRRTRGASSLEPITIPSLGHPLSGGLAEDRHLCPLRCLNIYLSRMKLLREGKKLLFISLQMNKSSDIFKNTMSGLVRSLLHFVYTNATKDTSSLLGKSAHASLAIVASLDFMSQIDKD